MASVGKGVPGYVTPKVAVGAAVGNDKGEILLVQRADSGVWLYPTGWADVGYSAAEVVVKEVAEETGIEVEVVRLIAVLDGLRVGMSRIPLYSLVFQCRPVGGELKAHPLECADVGWFPLDKLPFPLAGAERWGEHVFSAAAGRCHRGALRLGAFARVAGRPRPGLNRQAADPSTGRAAAGRSRSVPGGAEVRWLHSHPVTPEAADAVPVSGSDRSGSADITLRVTEVTDVTPDLVAAFARLIPQLSASNPPPSHADLVEMADSPASVLLVVTDVAGTVVGSLTLALFRVPTGLRAWIEDVVVDESARGAGAGEALVLEAVARARALGARSVDLTSRPSREAANRLYVRLGFEARTTNVYRYSLGA